MRKAITVLTLGFVFSTSTYAQDCADIVSELQAMKRAQNAIQMSLVANHNIIADSMESYADALSATAGRAHKTVSGSLQESAMSFRDRGQKARGTAKKLDAATAELIQKITKCLK